MMSNPLEIVPLESVEDRIDRAFHRGLVMGFTVCALLISLLIIAARALSPTQS